MGIQGVVFYILADCVCCHLVAAIGFGVPAGEEVIFQCRYGQFPVCLTDCDFPFVFIDRSVIGIEAQTTGSYAP